jgi:hypothetical protein
MTPPPERDQLFISYSHVDRGWVDRLQKMIWPLVRSEALRLWDDSQIPAGAKWKVEIEKASAKVALLLVSDDFLASEFVPTRSCRRCCGLPRRRAFASFGYVLAPASTKPHLFTSTRRCCLLESPLKR